MTVVHPRSQAAPGLSPASTGLLAGICLVTAILGAVSGLVLIFMPAQVPDDRFSYPFRAAPFVAVQVWFFVQHLGLAAGQYALQRNGAGSSWKHSGWGHTLGIAGMIGLAIVELIAISARNSPYPSDRTDVLDVLYGLTSIAIGVGLIVAGTGILKDRSWTGWSRWLPLALGVWVFVPMTPAIAIGYLPARLAITSWMLLYAALGWVLLQRSRQQGDGSAR